MSYTPDYDNEVSMLMEGTCTLSYISPVDHSIVTLVYDHIHPNTLHQIQLLIRKHSRK